MERGALAGMAAITDRPSLRGVQVDTGALCTLLQPPCAGRRRKRPEPKRGSAKPWSLAGTGPWGGGRGRDDRRYRRCLSSPPPPAATRRNSGGRCGEDGGAVCGPWSRRGAATGWGGGLAGRGGCTPPPPWRWPLGAVRGDVGRKGAAEVRRDQGGLPRSSSFPPPWSTGGDVVAHFAGGFDAANPPRSQLRSLRAKR